MAKRKVIFLGGWGRSGSSVIANVLGSHPAATSVGELRYIWDRGIIENKRCGCGEIFSECEFWTKVLGRTDIDANAALAEHQTTSIGSGATWRQLLAMLTGGVRRYRTRNAREIADLEAVYQAAAETSDKDILVDASKTPPYVLNLLNSEDLEVHFVHLVRDPRAVAYSWSRKRETKETSNEFLPRYSAFKSSVYWIVFNFLGLWFRSREDCSYMMVRYESFCEDPRSTVDRILAHCGVSGTEDLCWYDATTVGVQPQHSISGNPSRFNIGKVSIKPDDEWRARMGAGARRVVTVLCAPMLKHFGYGTRR